ncbi:MAG: phage integrase SAM-like domain-containing protein [Alistipes sp.]|nr:phage integrase SAM-like domain-containing protein [Alistipes sp.]MBO5332053.1 phage integrase SAM-like domain-containing protein [Alistipes sp.]MBO5399465.1 phage integrase SAM-like domain-containing protein [Alistipes sp.]
MKITTTLSTKTDKHTQKSEILLRLIVGKVNGKAVAFRAKSRIFVSPERWDATAGTIQTDIRTTRVMSAQKRREVEEEKQALQETSSNLSALISEIKSKFLATPVEQITKEWLEDVIDRYRFPEKYKFNEEKPAFFATLDLFLNKHKLSEVRKKNFRVIYRALQRFEIWNRTTLDLDTITQETLRDFEEFLRVENTFFRKDERSNKWSCINEDYKAVYEAYPETRTPQARGQNTINDIFTKLRTFYLWCIDNGKTTNNPFRHYKIEECVYGTPYYITIEERNQLYKADLSARPALAIQRDIFVFQCLIGCRVGDLHRFTKANIINGAIEYIARKTRDNRAITVRVPLNAIAKEILERYADHGGDKLLPFISEQKYNIAIKEAFKLAGITRIVTIRNPTTGEEEQRPINEIASSHLARRCFVGNLYKQVKDPNLVGALSGHKQGSKAFTRYREIDEEMKQDLVKLLE